MNGISGLRNTLIADCLVTILQNMRIRYGVPGISELYDILMIYCLVLKPPRCVQYDVNVFSLCDAAVNRSTNLMFHDDINHLEMTSMYK